MQTGTLSSCFLCTSSKLKTVWKALLPSGFLNSDYEIKIVICRTCGLVFQNPRMSEIDLEKHYKKEAFYLEAGKKEIIPRRLNQLRRIYSQLKEKGIKKGSILDIGCYSGQLMRFFDRLGFDVWGIEPSKKMVKELKKEFSRKIKEATIKEMPKKVKKRNFNLVILNHVLEHLYSPKKALEILANFLSNSGYLYVEVPDVEHIPVNMLTYFSVEHLNYFSKSTLISFVENCGFKTIFTRYSLNKNNIEPNYPVIMSLFRKNKTKKKKINKDIEAIKKILKNVNLLKKRRVKLKKRIKKILENEKGRKIALWGAGSHTSMLFGLIPSLKKEILAIFDNNPEKRGMQFNGIKVYSEPDLIIVKPDVIIISSYAGEKDIYIQLRKICSEEVRIVKLYG